MDSGKIIDYGIKNLNDHTRHCSPDVSSSSQTPRSNTENAVTFTTDLWTDNDMNRSYLDVSFFWISQGTDESGIGKELWALKRAMYACKVFPKLKTTEIIEFE
ncbi:hypothetical protein LOD99_3931 [Oopsacas minuta]|uniref:Uncharacterized protein n=1 Tax=Oopsacas minuta TaxID=111878 RepID=A0AAV7JXR3_9METZ|nr:hypothetical protein LOD99_3931 [Oopsacas minuta]